VLSGGLDYDWDGDTPPTKTLAQALAEALKIDLADAQELADVEPTELSGHSDGMTYGYLFDFTRRVRPELAAKLMAQHGSLQLEVQPWCLGQAGWREVILFSAQPRSDLDH
jgi:hypothetical protein